MAVPHLQFRRIVALISLVAVVLGVFEHESLLFHASGPASDLAASAPVAHEPDRNLEAFGPVDRDGGTEGTFRSEGKALCSVPAGQPRFVWRLPVPRIASESAALPLHLRAHCRARISGVRALRL